MLYFAVRALADVFDTQSRKWKQIVERHRLDEWEKQVLCRLQEKNKQPTQQTAKIQNKPIQTGAAKPSGQPVPIEEKAKPFKPAETDKVPSQAVVKYSGVANQLQDTVKASMKDVMLGGPENTEKEPQNGQLKPQFLPLPDDHCSNSGNPFLTSQPIGQPFIAHTNDEFDSIAQLHKLVPQEGKQRPLDIKGPAPEAPMSLSKSFALAPAPEAPTPTPKQLALGPALPIIPAKRPADYMSSMRNVARLRYLSKLDPPTSLPQDKSAEPPKEQLPTKDTYVRDQATQTTLDHPSVTKGTQTQARTAYMQDQGTQSEKSSGATWDQGTQTETYINTTNTRDQGVQAEDTCQQQLIETMEAELNEGFGTLHRYFNHLTVVHTVFGQLREMQARQRPGGSGGSE